MKLLPLILLDFWLAAIKARKQGGGEEREVFREAKNEDLKKEEREENGCDGWRMNIFEFTKTAGSSSQNIKINICISMTYNDLWRVTQPTDKWPLSLSVVGIVYPMTRMIPWPSFPLIIAGSHTQCKSQDSALLQHRYPSHTPTTLWCGRVGRTDPRFQAYMQYGKHKYNMQCSYVVAGVVNLPVDWEKVIEYASGC